jgi:hypothetical protein
LQGAVSAGSNVVLQLDTGEAALFSKNKYYYLYDFVSNANGQQVNYVRCGAVDVVADTITVQTLAHGFPAGAVIGAYPHRWYTTSTGGALSIDHINALSSPNSILSSVAKVPYCSSKVSNQANTFHNQSGPIYGGILFERNSEILDRLTPDDKGNFAVQRPGLVENRLENNTNSTSGMNRGYGWAKNMYWALLIDMARGLDGRIINGDRWMYFQRENDISSSVISTYATLFRNEPALV